MRSKLRLELIKCRNDKATQKFYRFQVFKKVRFFMKISKFLEISKFKIFFLIFRGPALRVIRAGTRLTVHRLLQFQVVLPLLCRPVPHQLPKRDSESLILGPSMSVFQMKAAISFTRLLSEHIDPKV